jgi:hydrogenase maturation factor
MSFDRHQPLPVGKLPSGLLGQLLSALGPSDPDVLVGAGLGRDAAAIAFGDRILVAKTDPITFATTNAAAYLVDVNANDLACLGATPRWLLVTALLPEGITAGEVIDLFAALDRASKLRGISLVGGHTEITAGLDRTILVGFLLGETARNRLLPPGGARPGDRLLLTKALAIEGTALLAAELRDLLVPRLGDDLVKRAAALITDPGISVLRDAQTLLAAGGISALHDVTEGGVAVAVREITAAGNLGAVIEATSVPVLPETKAIAAELGLDPLGMLGSGSLLATANPSAVPNLIAAAADAGVQMTEIGQITWEAASVILQRGNDRVPLPQFDTDEVSRALIQFQGGRNEDE